MVLYLLVAMLNNNVDALFGADDGQADALAGDLLLNDSFKQIKLLLLYSII